MVAFVPLGSLLGSVLARVVEAQSGWRAVLEVAGIGTLGLTALASVSVPESIYFLVRSGRNQARAIKAWTWAQVHEGCLGLIPPDDLDETDAFYSPFPMFHSSGRAALCLMSLHGGRFVGRGFGRHEEGRNEGGQDADDGNHDEQFDEREAGPAASGCHVRKSLRPKGQQ